MTRPRRTERSAPSLIAVIAGALVLAACSGGDEATTATSASNVIDTASTAPPETTEPPTTPPPPTTAAETVATEPITTEPPATAATTATSEPPADTEPSATTVAPAETTIVETLVGVDSPEAQAMLAALDRHITSQSAFADSPDDEALAAAFIATAVEDARGFAERYVEIVRRDGLAVRPNTDLPSRYEVFESSVTITDVDGAIDVCDIDGDVVVEVGAGDGGGDLVVNDELQSSVVSYSMRFVDGAWFVRDRETLAEFPDTEGCG